MIDIVNPLWVTTPLMSPRHLLWPTDQNNYIYLGFIVLNTRCKSLLYIQIIKCKNLLIFRFFIPVSVNYFYEILKKMESWKFFNLLWPKTTIWINIFLCPFFCTLLIACSVHIIQQKYSSVHINSISGRNVFGPLMVLCV